MHALVINLEKSRDRWNMMTHELASQNLKVVRINAIDSRIVDINGHPVSDVCKAYCPKGVIGAGLSHMKAWQYVVDNNLSEALIMEDDVYFKGVDLKAEIDKRRPFIPDDADIVLLGNFFSSYWLQMMLVPFQGYREYKVINQYVYQPMNFGGFFCYYVTNRGARNLLKYVKEVSFHIDLVVSKSLEIKYYEFTDTLAFTDSKACQSSIQTSNVACVLDNVRLPFLTQNISMWWLLNISIADLRGFQVKLYSLIILLVLCIMAIKMIKK